MHRIETCQIESDRQGELQKEFTRRPNRESLLQPGYRQEREPQFTLARPGAHSVLPAVHLLELFAKRVPSRLTFDFLPVDPQPRQRPHVRKPTVLLNISHQLFRDECALGRITKRLEKRERLIRCGERIEIEQLSAAQTSGEFGKIGCLREKNQE